MGGGKKVVHEKLLKRILKVLTVLTSITKIWISSKKFGENYRIKNRTWEWPNA